VGRRAIHRLGVPVEELGILRGANVVKNAWEHTREYSCDGKVIKNQWIVGPIIPWSIVALAALWMGHGIIPIPPSFWDFFKR
jgi:hypothetical protein